MGRRLLVSAVLAYVVLEFANPLHPGAVTFVAGELETVEGAKTRAPDTPAPAATLRAEAPPPPRWRPPRQTGAHPSPGAGVAHTARSHPAQPSGDAPASPDDH